MLDTLKEKQNYYQFDGRPYRFKTAPELDRDLMNALKAERLDRAYRFVWGGVVIVREEEDAISYSIARGSKEACHVVQKTMPKVENIGTGTLVQHEVRDLLLPKYLFARALQARGYCYYDDLNQKVSGFTREELVPIGKLARVDYRYVDFGMLFWFLEARANAQELVDARVYDAKENVPEEDWTCVMVLKTTAGKYYEPGLEMIPVLQKREWENQNANLKDVAREMMQRSAKARLDTEAKEEEEGDKQFGQLFDDVVRDVERNRTYSTPSVDPPKLHYPYKQNRTPAQRGVVEKES